MADLNVFRLLNGSPNIIPYMGNLESFIAGDSVFVPDRQQLPISARDADFDLNETLTIIPGVVGKRYFIRGLTYTFNNLTGLFEWYIGTYLFWSSTAHNSGAHYQPLGTDVCLLLPENQSLAVKNVSADNGSFSCVVNGCYLPV